MGVVLLGLMGAAPNGWAVEVRTVLGMAHDNNLFEAPVDPQGGWINRVNHVSYVIVDGPNAHAVENAVWELKLAEWNTVEIRPIITLEEAMKTLAEA